MCTLIRGVILPDEAVDNETICLSYLTELYGIYFSVLHLNKNKEVLI